MEKVIVLKSGKCSWGKCLFCGWGRQEYEKKSLEDFKKLMGKTNFSNCSRVKVFASGSFFDSKQFTKQVREYFAQKLRENKVKEVVVESRPEFITHDKLKEFEGIELIVAIGLEVADNDILKKISKGFTVEDYVKASKIIHENKGKVRTYLLVNPPLVGNVKKALDKSVKFALEYSDELVLINTFPHSKAPIYEFWLQGKWKPLDKKEFKEVVHKWENNKNISVDFDNFKFRPRFRSKANLKGVGEEFLIHPHYEVWQDYFQRFYEVPERKRYALFLPCSFRKPYSKSRTHKQIMKFISGHRFFKLVHVIVVSSPGVIPYEFKNVYPFNAYDWPEWKETPEIKELYTEVTKKRIKNYLEHHKYEKVFVYLKPDSESFKAFEQACKSLKIEGITCYPIKKHKKIKEESKKNQIIHPVALEHLQRTLFNELDKK